MTIELKIVDDRKGWDKLTQTLAEFDGLAAYAGIFDPKLATRAYRHEFGEGVPERPFAGPSADEARGRALAVADQEIGDALDGDQTPKAALELVGEVFEDAARSYVEAGRVGGKALSKAARANDTRKLIDQGDMIDALETKVARHIDGEDS